MARDNFSKTIVKALRDRVSGICSKPNCRKRTIAAHSTNNTKIVNTGRAAHICAASRGGPRYDKDMSPEARKSIHNAIWLCGTHADEIDKDDEEKYSETVLREWKALAEQESRDELGERLPHKNDSFHALTTAFTGQQVTAISNTVHNVCRAKDNFLEELDSRFSVHTSYIDGKTITELRAKEPVVVTMNVRPDYIEEFKKGYGNLLEHGKDMEIDSLAISYEGSELIKNLSVDSNGTLKLSKLKLAGNQKLWLQHKDSNEVFMMDDFVGNISYGSRSFTFTGSACDGLMSITIEGDTTGEGQTSLMVNTDMWKGKDIRKLPFLRQIYSFYKKILEGWLLCTSLKHDGETLLDIVDIDGRYLEYCANIESLLSYTIAAQTIAAKLDVSIPFTNSVEFSVVDCRQLKFLADALTTNIEHNSDDFVEGYVAKTELVIDENYRNLILHEDAMTIKIEEPAREVSMFNVAVTLPVRTTYFSDVKAVVTNLDGNLREGDVAKIDWVPRDGFAGITCYPLVEQSSAA